MSHLLTSIPIDEFSYSILMVFKDNIYKFSLLIIEFTHLFLQTFFNLLYKGLKSYLNHWEDIINRN